MKKPFNPIVQLPVLFFLAIALNSCKNSLNEEQADHPTKDVASDTVDSTYFATTDTLGKVVNNNRTEYIPSAQLGYYRTFTPPSFLLDEKGNKTIVNGNSVQVPATVSYIQLKAGQVYGVQLAQGQQFLFTGFYDYAAESTAEKGTLNLALNGRYLKTGKSVGPWSPQIRYTRKGSDYSLTLIGVSGAPDSPMSFVAAEIPTAKMQELMKEEEDKLR